MRALEELSPLRLPGGPLSLRIMRKAARLVLVPLLFAAAAAVLPAQSAPGALRWRFIGPFRGGRVLAVAGVPGEAAHFYFGSVNGGVWETQDAGRTWQPIFDGEDVASIGAIALAPSNPRIVYVGTGEADMRSDIAQGEGMYKSADGGRTWRHIGLTDSQQIAHISVHPDNPDVVFVAALGHPYGPNVERGVFRSGDGGATWTKVLGPDENTGAVDVIFEPGNPRVLYAALWQTRRTPWNVYPPSSGPGGGLYKSTDGGEHWTRLTDGLPPSPGRIGLAIPTSVPSRVYAVVDAEPGGGLYRSDDSGAHWKRVSADPRVWQRGWYFGRITVDPRNPDRLFAMNTIVLRSDDGGATFAAVKGDPTGDDFHELWIDPSDGARQILASDQGTLVTVNGGRTWSSWYNQPTAQFYHVATDNRFPYFVYGSQQDSGAAGVPSRTTGMDGINLTTFREVSAGGESDNVVPDPTAPDVLYGGRVDRLDLRTGQTRSVAPVLAYPEVHRVTWTLPLVFSPRSPKVLYFAHQHLYRTGDRGEHWDRISEDLTREDPGTPSTLDPPTANLTERMGPRRGVIYAIGPSPVADGHIWVGTDDGLIWRTRDEGKKWENVTPKDLAPWSKIGVIEPSHHDAETAYAAVDRHRLDDFAPYIYRTHDGGKTWTLSVDGIARTEAVNVVREDPVRRGLLFAGTERRIYVSFDDGSHWTPLQMNLPRTSVRDIAIKWTDVIVATHGRGFWIMDDISLLRQVDSLDTPAATRLFAPAPAVRVRPDPFVGTPFPKDEPAAENPAIGAYIDYALASTPASPITLIVRAADGSEVRRYSSDDRPPSSNPGTSEFAPEWADRPSSLAATPGIHRFAWPVRYAAAGALGTGAFADGVWAPPGKYSVELIVDGKSLTQPLEILPDPRVRIPAAAYAEQFQLAKRIEGLRVRVADAASAAGKLQSAVTERRTSATGTAATLLDEFQQKLTAVTGSLPATIPGNVWWIPGKASSLRFVSEKLDALDLAVEGADAAPSPDARAGIAKVEAMLPAALASWDRLQGTELDALNAQLAAAGQARIVIATPARNPGAGPAPRR
jgi:photosystem II stability/assembly factor-like uncharacterized protein